MTLETGPPIGIDATLVQAPLKPLGRNISADDMVAHVELIRDLFHRIMRPGIHYGVIPGTGDKPSLLKPGADLILVACRIGYHLHIEDLSGPGLIRYRVRARAFHQGDRTELGESIGECSSGEDKYAWRRVVSNDEWEAVPNEPGMRRVKYAKDRKTNQAFAINQVRTNPLDAANTVLKMAKKRAITDLALSVTAASEVFTQDQEDPDVGEGGVYPGGAAPSPATAGYATPAAAPAPPPPPTSYPGATAGAYPVAPAGTNPSPNVPPPVAAPAATAPAPATYASAPTAPAANASPASNGAASAHRAQIERTFNLLALASAAGITLDAEMFLASLSNRYGTRDINALNDAQIADLEQILRGMAARNQGGGNPYVAH